MKHDTRDEMIAFIKERARDIDDIVDLIIGLESAYDFRACLITRNDVESEFEDSWLYESDEKRKMNDEEWEKFRSAWLWRKGHSEMMWDGIPDAIRLDLRDAGLLPDYKVS
jgi:hypothetical protein